VGIIALQEINWTRAGILEKRDSTFFYNGHKSQHILGTCFAVKKNVKHLTVGYQGLTPHISTLRLKGTFFNHNSIKAHSLTDVESPPYDIKLILGDLKAKLGSAILLPSYREKQPL